VSGEVVSLAAERRRRALPARDRLAAQVERRGSLLVMLPRDREVAFTPAAARSFLNGFAGLIDQAEGVPGSTLGEAELRARLALLGDAVARFDSGETASVSGMSQIVALVRQLTAEVRR